MDMIFNRIRRVASDPEAPTIHFIVGDKVVRQLDEGDGMEDAWRQYEKWLQFKPCKVIFRRVANRKRREEPLWHGYFELPDVGEWLRFAFVASETAFFVLGIQATTNLPAVDGYSLERVIVPEFLADGRRHRETEAYWLMLEALEGLRITPEVNRRAAKDEIANWNKYLQAIEKVTKEKTVLLPVVYKETKEDRRRGTTIHFEMDWERWVRAKLADFDVLNELGGLSEFNVSKETVMLRWVESPELDAEEEQLVEDLLKEACLRWVVPPTAPRWVLEFKVETRYGQQAEREKRLRSLDGQLRSLGLTVSRKAGQYQWQTWAEYAQWQASAVEGVSIWEVDEAPRVRLRLKHPLQAPEGKKQAVHLLAQSLKGQGAEMQMVAGDEKARFVLPGGRTWVPEDEWTWCIDAVSIAVTVPLVPVQPKEEGDGSQPVKAWTNIHGSERDGEVVALKGKELAMLRRNYEALRAANPGFSFPEWPTVRVAYQVSLVVQSQPEQFWGTLRQGVKKIGSIQVDGLELSLRPLTEAELKKTCERIAGLRPRLEVELVEITAGLTFHQESAKLQSDSLARGLERLRKQFGKDLQDKMDKSSLQLWLSRPAGQQYAQVKPLLESVCGEELQYRVDRPEGMYETVLEPDRKQRGKWSEERWSDLRGRMMKFLTDAEQEEYVKEITGRGGNYHGGKDLGKLRAFLEGNPKVLVEEGMEAPKVAKTGWLLPTFIGDLAQISRLREAMRLLEHPREGLPINRRLGQFIFDPSLARPISLGLDVQSDRDWQLRHALIERELNDRQREAVWRALHAEDMALVQGPPGTGKTTVIAEIIWQALQEDPNQRILISSQSHLAVDNALERLYKQNIIRPLRIAAHTGKQVEPEGRVYFAEVIDAWAKAASDSKEEQENADNAVSRWMRRINDAVVPQEKFARAQGRWLEMLRKPAPSVKGFMKDIYLANVNVVAATCLECGRKEFKDRYKEQGFDYVIVDEASKATPPELMVPLILARRVIIIGDHRQLPPMVDERELKEVLQEIGELQLAEELESFKVSQFEKLFLGTDASLHVTLNTQYRMHDHIMQVINPFYAEEGGLVCGITKEMDVADLSCRGSRWHGLQHPRLLSYNDHLIWVDVNSPEIKHEPGYSNDGEVEAVREVLRSLLQSEGWAAYNAHFKREEDREIGLISFYGKQAEKLKVVVDEFKGRVPIRLRTVDKFQGMERNIMIVSTVRSDTQVTEGTKESNQAQAPRRNTDIGFAKDYRRVNVAFSRARRLLIIVGNEGHFANNNDMYQEIKKVVGRYGQRLDAKSLQA